MAISRSNTTFASVTFYSFDKGILPTYWPSLTGGPVSSVTAFDTRKRLGEPTGSWTIEMWPYVLGGTNHGKAWTDLVFEGDWVVIDVVRNGVFLGIMIGRIDDVSVSQAAGPTGAGETMVTISGRDVGAPIEDTPIYWNPYDATNDNATGLDLAARADLVQGRADEIIPAVIRAAMGRGGVFGGHTQIPAGFVASPIVPPYWIDMLDLRTVVVSPLRGQCIPNLITAEGASSVWAWMNDWRNPILNEMWLDTTTEVGATRKAYLHLRERPFVNSTDGSWSPWFFIQKRDVEASSIASLSVARGRDRVNHVMILGDLLAEFGKDPYQLYRPIINKSSIKRYGLKRLEQSTQFFVDVAGDAGFQTKSREWLDLLVSWNCMNHLYWSGTISIGEMRPDIRVGQKIAIKNGPPAGYLGWPTDLGVGPAQMTFYVEGVQHRWTDGEQPMAETTLMVSRGYVEGQRLPDLLAEKAKFAAVPLIPASSATDDGVLGLDDDIDPGEGRGVLS